MSEAMALIEKEISHSTREGIKWAKWGFDTAAETLPRMINGVVLLIIFTILAIRLIHRMLKAHPDNRMLWILTLATLIFLALFVLTGFTGWVFLYSGIAAFILASIYAMAIEIRYEQRIFKPLGI